MYGRALYGHNHTLVGSRKIKQRHMPMHETMHARMFLYEFVLNSKEV